MGRKSKFMAKKRLDKYYKLAKDEGYKSRAAFKLLQINKEIDFLGSCRCLLDLCAAPGGWTQVAAKHMPLSSLIVAADLCKMKPLGGAKIVTGDIFTQQCKYDIKKCLQGWQCDAVIHDGAPNVTGAWATDAYGQCRLTLQSLKLATDFLRPGGLFITKVFRSADYNALLWVVNHFFESVTTFKPKASRSSSAEIYWICKNYLAPKKIDPRLLDAKFAFSEVSTKNESVSVMRLRKRRKEKRNRQGYADGIQYLGKSAPVTQFLDSEKPEAVLGDFHKFEFDDDCHRCKLVLSNEKLTTAEIKYLLADLKVLGKVDFRKLLRWRLKVKKYMVQVTGGGQTPEGEGAEDDEGEENEEVKTEEEKMRSEVENVLFSERREERKRRRKVRRAKIRDTRTMLMGGIKPQDVAWNTGADQQRGLFSLAELGSEDARHAFAEKQAMVRRYGGGHFDNFRVMNAAQRRARLRAIAGGKGPSRKVAVGYVDTESEVRQLEDGLDAMYREYKVRRAKVLPKDERRYIEKRLELGADDEVSDESDEEWQESSDSAAADSRWIEVERARVESKRPQRGGGLLLDATLSDGSRQAADGKWQRKAKAAQQWFADELFDAIEDGALETERRKEVSQSLMEAAAIDAAESKRMRIASYPATSSRSKKSGKLRADDILPEILKVPYRVQRKLKKTNRDKRRRLARDEAKQKAADGFFEEVAVGTSAIAATRKRSLAEMLDSDEENLVQTGRSQGLGAAKALADASEEVEEVKEAQLQLPSDSEDSDDSDAIAETVAIGAKLLKKKSRGEIVDGSYRKFAFAESGRMPHWFREDEAEAYVVQLPVTKAEVAQMKARMRAVNARPIKKVAEAKARKKLRAMRAWNRVQKTATGIANSTEIGERSKVKAIQSLYAKHRRAKKFDKAYMVSTGKGRKARPLTAGKLSKSAAKVFVDKRLKSDKRGRKRQEIRAKKGVDKKQRSIRHMNKHKRR